MIEIKVIEPGYKVWNDTIEFAKGCSWRAGIYLAKKMEDNDFEEMEEEAPARGGGACAVDPALYSMLKDLRKKMSKHLEVPPYVIFQDPSLEAMATIYPITLEELQNIPGVGDQASLRRK